MDDDDTIAPSISRTNTPLSFYPVTFKGIVLHIIQRKHDDIMHRHLSVIKFQHQNNVTLSCMHIIISLSIILHVSFYTKCS